MKHRVFVDYYDIDFIDKKEVLRYCGVKNRDRTAGELDRRIDLLSEEALSLSPFRAVWTVTRINSTEEGIDAGFGVTESETVKKGLEDCEETVIVCATLGRDFDRILEKYKKLSASDSVMFQAIGTALIEQVLDSFCKERNQELQREEKVLRPRFSPGYGDFYISFQKSLLQLLDASRNLGIYLNDSFLMTPSKSVTALCGIRKSGEEFKTERDKGCRNCSKQDCAFRSENGH